MLAAGILVVLFAAELEPYPIKFGGLTLLFWLTFFSVIMLTLCLVILFAAESKKGAGWVMFGYIACMLLLDLLFLTTHVNKFWVPTFITMAVLSFFNILHFFNIPQCFY